MNLYNMIRVVKSAEWHAGKQEKSHIKSIKYYNVRIHIYFGNNVGFADFYVYLPPLLFIQLYYYQCFPWSNMWFVDGKKENKNISYFFWKPDFVQQKFSVD